MGWARLGLGQLHGLGIFEQSAVALLDIKDWQFKRPMLVGMTIRLRLTIVEKEPGRSGRTGRIARRFELLDQNGEVVQVGRSDALVLTERPETGPARPSAEG